jgi:serine/threonine-protein kinase
VSSTERAEELGDRRWRDLLQQHDALVRREVERHGGHEMNTAGDGFLVTFEEPERAVRCAEAVREALRGIGLRIRCGLHTGEVQRVGDGIGGIGVHTAARVAALARPDEILVSRTVRDLLAGSELVFANRGIHALKGISGEWQLFALGPEAEAVPALGKPAWFRNRQVQRLGAAGAVALVTAIAFYAWASRPGAEPSSASPSGGDAAAAGDRALAVAVLPFVNASPDLQDEYFSDGLTEELISAISGIEGLRVPGRTSSFAFKDSAQDIRQIGEVLGVSHVLEGSVRRSGQRLRIDARLVGTADGYGVWSETYDRNVEDALEIQADIANAIAGALELELLDPLASGAATPGRTTDPVAYDHYLRGLYFSHAPTEDGVRKSIDYYQRAIEADPNFALAHAGLAIAYHGIGNRYGAGQTEYMPKAKAAAERALELDDGLAESHLALAIVKGLWDRDYTGAEREFRRAIEIRPNYAGAHHGYGVFLAMMHRPDESIAAVRKALSLDPLSNFYSAALGVQLLYNRRYDESITQLQRTLEQEPDNARIWLILGRAYVATGRYEEAFDAFRQAERVPGLTARKLTYVGHAYAVAGQQRQAAEMLRRVDSLARHEHVLPTNRAMLELALGYRDRALERLERAERERELDIVPFQLDERLDPLRADPRFRRIVERMGLPEDHRRTER